MDFKYDMSPQMGKTLDTNQLRDQFLAEKIFIPGEITQTYAYVDRYVFGGVSPIKEPLYLTGSADLGVETFLERREVGIVNLGGPGSVSVGDKRYELGEKDSLYLGKQDLNIAFESSDPSTPAMFYYVSTPAHQSYPDVIIPIENAQRLELGETAKSNVRVINQIIHPDVCQTCQLLMGMTCLAPGSIWNTMPCHTHARRSEIYFYFELGEEDRVFHMMGEPSETRHLVVAYQQATISPSWSIHSGVGTSNYSFIWAMAGDNQVFTDMDAVAMEDLK